MSIPLKAAGYRIGENRLLSVDSLRGFAMLLVFLQHSYLSIDRKVIPPLLDTLLWDITHLAPIAFVSISGLMYSYFLYMQSAWKQTYHRYTARAAFLIFAVHPAINLMTYSFRFAQNSSPVGANMVLERFFLDFPITDTIAVCILVSPMFIIGMGAALRTASIVIMWAATAFVRVFVTPQDLHLVILKEAIFGSVGEPKVFWFPFIPWLAIFLTGSFMGQCLARMKQGTLRISSLIKGMNKTAICLIMCSTILVISSKLLKTVFANTWGPNIFLVMSPATQTTTLLPGYLAMLILLFVAFLKRIEVSGHYDLFAWSLSIFGRTSLFTYVAQFAVIESAPAMLGLKGTLGFLGFLALFTIGLTIMWFLSYIYGSMRGWFRKDDYLILSEAAAGMARRL